MSIGILIILIVIGFSVLYLIKNRGGQDPNKNDNLTNEVIVCRDITEIYCNTISCIDTLCGINKSVTTSLEKFLSSVSLSGSFETYQLKSLEDEIDFRLREIKSFEENIPDLKFSIHSKGKKHSI